MNLQFAPYIEQQAIWPKSGKHVMAQFDNDSIIVYQAYNHAIADYAVEHQSLGGDFTFNRMTWIKPNFLWMMYRSGWGTKENQERTLALRISRLGFDTLLNRAVHSSFNASNFASETEWKNAVAVSDTRLQWDPDHSPDGAPIERRAVQIGIRGKALRSFCEQWILEIGDLSDFVKSQLPNLNAPYKDLMMPVEFKYRSFE